MSTPSFPKEVTDLIVDELGSLPRSECLNGLLACSTAHSSLTKPCQAYIFRDVTLGFPPDVFSPLDKHYEVYESSMLFVEAVTANPELVAYVRNLHLRATVKPTVGRNKALVLGTVERLSSVTALRIAGDLMNDEDEVGDGGRARLDQDIAAVIVSALLQPQLRSLSVAQISGYPAEFITLGANLDTLSVSCSSVSEGNEYSSL